jgi:REP element-mobilizing transposase RayT
MAKRAKQISFSGKAFARPSDSFGGALLKGNPKTARPLDSKMPVHLVLRANQGGMRLPKAFGSVASCFSAKAEKYGVRIYSYANVGNHIHAVIRVTKIRLWAAFIRELTSALAFLMSGIVDVAGKFWKQRPFTRIVRGWKTAYRTAVAYVELNQLEADGHISRKDTKTLRHLRAIFDG